MDHIGIDIHKRENQICILTEDGELLERRVRTEAGRFAEVLRMPDRAARRVEQPFNGLRRCLSASCDAR